MVYENISKRYISIRWRCCMDLENKTLNELAIIYNSLWPTVRVKRFASKDSAIARIKRLQDDRKKKGRRSKGQVSKISIVREMFNTKDTWTREELAKKAGFDTRNLVTAMSILKNPKRTKDLLITKYDHSTHTYTLVAGQ